jgi:16S rRNA A1518/A1519 N6-dimethyltransferase RsmA/KsgA/DIM1 with predicted DNA glycosylase/AP lyase activity
MKKQLSKSQIDESLSEANLRADQRAEQLSVEKILTLCEAVRSRLPQLVN